MCKRIILIFNEKYNNKIPLEEFKNAFEFSAKKEYATEEIACIVGNQFYIGYLKGYVYEGHTVVLSKTTPYVKFLKCVVKNEEEWFLLEKFDLYTINYNLFL